MILRNFNKAWGKERGIIEKQLIEKLSQNIKDIDFSMKQQAGPVVKEAEDHLRQLRNELVARRSMAVYEAEEIVRNRMQLRASYLALVMSSVALIISVATVLAKI
jgi:hypothetical protein